MNRKGLIFSIAATALLYAACKEDELKSNSEIIQILSPVSGERILASDSVILEVRFEPKITSVEGYQLSVKNLQGKDVHTIGYFKGRDSLSAEVVRDAFIYPNPKSEDYVLEVIAWLKNGQTAKKSQRFQLIK